MAVGTVVNQLLKRGSNRRPVDAVEEAHQHALLGSHLQRLQHLRERLGALAQLLIGP